jgi:hypothetical protein
VVASTVPANSLTFTNEAATAAVPVAPPASRAVGVTVDETEAEGATGPENVARVVSAPVSSEAEDVPLARGTTAESAPVAEVVALTSPVGSMPDDTVRSPPLATVATVPPASGTVAESAADTSVVAPTSPAGRAVGVRLPATDAVAVSGPNSSASSTTVKLTQIPPSEGWRK